MIELIEPVFTFIFFFIIPMIFICSIPALFVGGVMVNVAEKNKESKK